MLENYLDFAEDVTKEKATRIDLKEMIIDIIETENTENKDINFNQSHKKINIF